jgi:hypothetical protein
MSSQSRSVGSAIAVLVITCQDELHWFLLFIGLALTETANRRRRHTAPL